MPDKRGIVVVGSANMDLVVRAERLPAAGETVLGGSFLAVPGGKGANQAVAAARLGGVVTFVGRVGADSFGDALAAGMHSAGIDTTLLARDLETPTGVALIGVDANGQNSIIVAPGANHKLSRADVDKAEQAIAGASMLVIQLEIPIDTVEYAVGVAKRHAATVLMNPAPIRGPSALAPELLSAVGLLTPNEHEAAALLGIAVADDIDWLASARLLRRRVKSKIVVTLGSAGCVVSSAEGEFAVPAPAVEAIDTTAAGDCFTGALAVALSEGFDLKSAVEFASRAAAISVTRLGAQSSLPTRAEI